MQGVSRGVVRRSAVLLALITIFTAQVALAADRDDGRNPDPFGRAKRFVVELFSRFGFPPG